MAERRKVAILGAAGRDFHNFNVFYRGDPETEVVAFTASQIPDIAGRRYPASLAGSLYPDGIPIVPEAELSRLVEDAGVRECAFSYSDVPYSHVMGLCAVAQAAGASFRLLGPRDTQLRSSKPVVAVCAVRTGAGKSQTSRKIVRMLMDRGLRVVAVRHPMPYGDLEAQRVQRFATFEDLDRHRCTVEELEEYEPHVARGNVIYAGVDYADILREAEKEADVILWDGGNNDFPFFAPDLLFTVVDPLRPGDETSYYPGETCLRMADAVVLNKIDSARPEDVQAVRDSVARAAPRAVVVEAASPVSVDKPELLRGARVLCVEDGPTLTHGRMKIGAGVVAARKFGAASLVDPRPFAAGLIAETFRLYPGIGELLPAMGYGSAQVRDLEATIARADCDVVAVATPIDLARIVRIDKPTVKVTYDLQEIGKPDLASVLDPFLARIGLGG